MDLLIQLTIFTVVLLLTMFLCDRYREKVTCCMNRWNDVSDRNISILLFLAVLCMEGIQVIYRTQPFIADEVYTLTGGMFFAGYDVSSYMSNHKLYNFGYTMLLSPLFRLIDDPVVLYRCLLGCNVILHGITIVVVYNLLRKKFGFDSVKSVAMAAVSSCSFLILQFGMYVYNETPLTFIVWMVFALLIIVMDVTGWKKYVISAMIAFLTSYAYIIHSRCMVLFVVVFLVILSYLFIYRKWIVNPIAFGVPFIAGIYGARKLVDFVKVNLYLKGLDEDLGNSVEAVAGATSRYKVFASGEGIFKLIQQFFSLAGSLNIVTGGFILIATIFGLYQFTKFKGNLQDDKTKKLLVSGIYSIVSFWGMVACIAVSGAASGITRFLAYIRYFTPFIGPFLLFAMIALLKNMVQIKKTILYSCAALGNIIVVLVFIFYSFPKFVGTSMKDNGTLYFFLAFARYDGQTKFSKSVIGIALLIMIAGTVVFLFFFYKKRYIYMATAFVGFSILLTYNVETIQNQPAAKRRYEVNDVTWQLIKSDVLPEDIEIYYDGSERYRKTTLTTLFAEEPKCVNDMNTITDLSDAILLTNVPRRYENHDNTYVFKLDKSEFVLTQDEEVKEILLNNYELYEIEDETDK